MGNAKRSSLVSILILSIFAFTFSFNAHAALTPQLEWIRTYDSPAHNLDRGQGVALDAAGNVYVNGTERRNDLGQNSNIWLRKYDTDGNTLWTETYDSPAHGHDYGRGAIVDTAGNVYVTGFEKRDDLGQSNNIWLRKYDTDGNALWTQTYDSPAHSSDLGHGVTVDAAGNVYVTGQENRSDLDQSDNIWLRKYNTDGNTIWTETYDGPAHSSDMGIDVALDSAGNLYVTGYEERYDLDEDYNIVLLKYAQVPEPGSILLLAPGFLGIAGIVLKRRK